MKRMIEITAFAGMALALHVAAFAVAEPRGSQSAGAAGQTLVSLAGASAQTIAMVEDWDRPPQVEEPEVLDLPMPSQPADTLPSLATPDAPVVPQPLPQMLPQPRNQETAAPAIDTQPAVPPQRYAPTVSYRPQARPTQQLQPARDEQRAAGSGGGNQAGQSTTSAVSTLSSGQIAELQAVWGAQIRSQIESRKRYPTGTRGSGQVVVTLTISNAGQLIAVAIGQSSGVASFDQAALRAVSSAGRFPAAPAELSASNFRFSLPLSFSR